MNQETTKGKIRNPAKTTDADGIIDANKINELLNCSSENARNVLKKALQLKGLEIEDVAVLLNISDEETLQELFATANKIKNQIYGNRLVLFAPLYVSNYCVNNCLYCGFRKDNEDIKRECLTISDIQTEVKEILRQGHKRILMLMGEHPTKCSFEYFLETINSAYEVKDEKGSSLRRINIEIAPLNKEQFVKLSKIPIGTYTVFQETYHKKTYEEMHISGKKSDYQWRLETMDRALSNGMHDVGIGALFGLYDYRFEVMALLQHANHLDKKFGVGPHTISIPRIEPAQNAPVAMNIPSPVSDTDFKKLVAVLRCAVPYTGIILSTREPPELRTALFDLGISQISAGSRTELHGYSNNPDENIGQFSLNDTRSTGEVIKSVIEKGYVPSFCTGCYRKGRVGQDFMDLAKPGLIKLHCLPNALTTLKEYLIDYADEETKALGNAVIEKQISEIPISKVQEKTKEFLSRIEHGERDLYF